MNNPDDADEYGKSPITDNNKSKNKKKKKKSNKQDIVNTKIMSVRELMQSICLEIRNERSLKPGSKLEKGSYGQPYIARNLQGNGKIFNNVLDGCIIGKQITGTISVSQEERKMYIDQELKISQLLLGKKLQFVVEIIEVDLSKSKVYMKHAGMNMVDFLKFGIIDNNFVRNFIIQITMACYELYKQGLIHRDVSFRNICIDITLTANSTDPKFTLIDLGSCSFNTKGTGKIDRKTDCPEDLVTWKTDIYFIGLCAKKLMSKTVSPMMDINKRSESLQRTFEELINLTDNMMSEDPFHRPDHNDILKSLIANSDGNFSMFALSSPRGSKVDDNDLIKDL